MKFTKNPKQKGFYYSISMYPYPSGNVHVGHARNFIIQDVYNRYLMLKGYDVESYLGWDSFGAPAEYAAIEHGMDPKKWTYDNINAMNEVIKRFGNYYHKSNYSDQLICSNKEYYNFQRKLFLKLFHAGLIYKKESYINWDPKFNTVLANEQVDENGISWRSGVKAERRKLSQWFGRITKYAEEFLECAPQLDWPARIINAQEQWIGKSEGYIYKFPIHNSSRTIDVFTTKPQTIEGCTFIAISKESEYVDWFDKKDGKIGECIYNNKIIPVYVADYVLDYGTGAVMGVPNGDERDEKFAKENGIPIINKEYLEKDEFIKLHNLKPVTQYKLRDWCISRQRSWGCPIPIIYCDKCGVVPDEQDVNLPEDLDFTKEGNPLSHCHEFVNVKCPKCHCNAKRETDTMDTFVDSSWYFLRYLNQGNHNEPFSRNICVPVDLYVGGAEHAVLHLLYARFFTKAFADLGLLNFREPFIKLINQGMVLARAFQYKDGRPAELSKVIEKAGKYYCEDEEVTDIGVCKMSKSLKNTVDPDTMIHEYGIEAVRMFIASEPIDVNMEWNIHYLNGYNRFTNNIKKAYEGMKDQKFKDFDNDLFMKANRLLVEFQREMDQFKANCAIAKMRELFNALDDKIKEGAFTYTLKWAFGRLLINLSPIMIDTCEEIYQQLFHKSIYSLGFYNDEWDIKSDITTIKLFINNKHIDDITNTGDKEEMTRFACQKHNISQYSQVIYVEDKMLKILK